MAAVGGERAVAGVAFAAVADLGEHLRGAQERVRCDEQGAERGTVGVILEGLADLGGQLADLLDDRLQRADDCEHDLPAGLGFELAGAPFRGVAQAAQQLAGGAPTGVAVPVKERRESLLPEPAGVCRTGVAT